MLEKWIGRARLDQASPTCLAELLAGRLVFLGAGVAIWVTW
jgi:hypothetical protein